MKIMVWKVYFNDIKYAYYNFLILKKHRCGYVHVKHSNSLSIDFSATLGNPYVPLGHIIIINYHVSPVVIDILRDKRMFYFGDFNHKLTSFSFFLKRMMHGLGPVRRRSFLGTNPCAPKGSFWRNTTTTTMTTRTMSGLLTTDIAWAGGFNTSETTGQIQGNITDHTTQHTELPKRDYECGSDTLSTEMIYELTSGT